MTVTATDASGGVTQKEPAVLSISNVSLRFGGLDVLKDVGFDVYRNEVVGLIGPNGAGKSALLNCILRVYEPAADARIALHGDTGFLGLPSHAIARRGVARTFQGLQLSPGLTVFDNIAVGRSSRFSLNVADSLLRPFTYSRQNTEISHRVHEIADLCGLRDVLHRLPEQLPLGVLRRVDLARALVGEPSLLLMDEPASGLSHDERPLIAELIRVAREVGNLSVIWVEHDLDLVFSNADRVIVLRNGTFVRDGRPADPTDRAALIEGYYS
ncbi:ABC transporter ATP-binding protein [Ochrobactrum teleogrylli]|uniref:ABC transporter ATP-binding protein n=1 Tax=Ochrobactrum teleogrylli TaxID=2479765 RepID=UPI00384BF2B6